jgi:threonine synthase
LPGLVLKDDTANPTGSLKDRASYLVAAFAVKHGIKRIVVASTGNAACSMAGVGAAAGLSVVIFVPERAPRAKIAQCLQYGAKVITVEGSYDKAYALSLDYSRREDALSRNTAYNPLTIEGKKTAAIEIVEDLGRAPDFVFLPAGDAVILSGLYKGFRDLRLSGTITDVPTVIAVQAQGSCALARAFEAGEFGDPRPSRTVADSIAADVPRAGYYALRHLRQYGGRCVTVSDDEILEAQLLLSSYSGLFAEPAAAASLAGLVKVRDQIPSEATIALLITGSGLKDIESAMRKVNVSRVSKRA